MEISRAAINDAQEILALQKLAFQSEGALYNNYDIAPLTQTLPEIQGEFKTHVFFKAVSDGKIIGTARACEKDGTCYIGRLAVHPDRQNQGVGSALMKEIESCSKVKRFELFVGSKSVRNQHLYRKLGYSVFKKELYGCGSDIEVFFMEKYS